jgi:hypothetical protein
MKSFDKTMLNLFPTVNDPYKALRCIEVALDFLFEDKEKALDDKVVGDYSFEELVGTLLFAKESLKTYTEYASQLEKQIEEIEDWLVSAPSQRLNLLLSILPTRTISAQEESL